MTGEDIVLISVLGPIVLGMIGLILHWIVEDTQATLWPRGLRWLPPAWERLEDRIEYLFRPEKRFLFTPRRIRYLEELDDAFRGAAGLYGTVPEWTGRDDVHGYWHAYGRKLRTCPCGYVEECALWCGDGHDTGACPEEHEGSLRWPG